MGFFQKLFGGKNTTTLYDITVSMESSNDMTHENKVITTINGNKIELLADMGYGVARDYRVSVICAGKEYGYAPEKNLWSYHKTGTPPDDDKLIAEWVENQV